MKKFLLTLFAVVTMSLVWHVDFVNAAPEPPNGQQQQGLLQHNSAKIVNSELTSPWFAQNYSKLREQAITCQDGSVSFECYSLASDLSKITNARAIISGLSDASGKPLVAGATSFFASGIAFMTTTPPASGIDYVAYMGNRISVPGVPTPAYAANSGIGFNRLNPILSIWTVTRNLAYMVFAVIFIAIGLMIMFRQKVDPKTVASIQNTLPKIVWALVLVTFSYPIAGFLIDLMYVLIALLLTMAAGAIPSVGGVDIGRQIAGAFQQNFLEGQSIFNFVGPGVLITFLSVGAISDITGLLTALPVVGGVVGPLAGLIIGIAILWALLKTWFMLLGAYANIILGVITAPLRLMMDAIPGQNQFGAWLRSMAANLLVFPLVIGMLFITLIIMMTAAPDLIVNGVANLPGKALTSIPVIGGVFAPFIQNVRVVDGGGWVPPLLGGNSLSDMAILVALGVFLTMPKAISILQEALKAPPFKYGNAWLEATKYGSGVTQGLGKEGLGRAYKPVVNELLGGYADRRRIIEKEYAAYEASGGEEGKQAHRAPDMFRTTEGALGALGKAAGATKQQSK